MPKTIIDFTLLVAQDRLPQDLSSIVVKACSYIGDHLFSPYDPEALTAYCKCSRSHLSHQFKEEMGVTIVQYIHGLKVEKACALLESSDMSVSRISAKLGFCSESYFISVFKKVKGTTPGRYRNHRIRHTGRP